MKADPARAARPGRPTRFTFWDVLLLRLFRCCQRASGVAQGTAGHGAWRLLDTLWLRERWPSRST